MDEIILDIQDTQGRVTTIAAHPAHPLAVVADVASEALNLPHKDAYGRIIRYALYHYGKGRFLNPDVTVMGLKVQAGDRLRIMPNAFNNLFELELQTVPNPGMLFPIAPKEITIGRDFNNNIVIRHKSVSRQHGIFEWRDGFHIYMDLGSANGSWINNQPVTRPTPIASGDLLALGNTIELRYRERSTGLDPVLEETDKALKGIDSEGSQTGLQAIPKAEIYLSYTTRHADLAKHLYEKLSLTGSKVYLKPEQLLQAMQRADVMVLILSRESVGDKHTLDQWRYYHQLRKPMIPVLVEPCQIPDFVSQQHLIEYQYDDGQLHHDILHTIQKVLT